MIVAAVLAATAFNLACSGTSTYEAIDGAKVAPFNYVYRIDLENKKFCDGECKATSDLTVEPTMLILANKNVDTATEKDFESLRIDRVTSVIRGYSSTRDAIIGARSLSTMKLEGKCEPMPFSGFPAFKTKF